MFAMEVATILKMTVRPRQRLKPQENTQTLLMTFARNVKDK